MDWIDTLKDLWWLAAAVLLLIGYVVKTAIKTSKVVEQVGSVKVHDVEIKSVKGEMCELKKEITEMHESLEKHIVDQKQDIQSINETLFAILDILKDMKDTADVKEAHAKLRKRQLER